MGRHKSSLKKLSRIPLRIIRNRSCRNKNYRRFQFRSLFLIRIR